MDFIYRAYRFEVSDTGSRVWLPIWGYTKEEIKEQVKQSGRAESWGAVFIQALPFEAAAQRRKELYDLTTLISTTPAVREAIRKEYELLRQLTLHDPRRPRD